MNKKEFWDKYKRNLIIEHNRTNIIFKTDDENIEFGYRLKLYFTEETFYEINNYLINISNEIWSDFDPKIANSINSDYDEYYDKKYDNNGYLTISYCQFSIERPHTDCPYMYKFNKRRMESFIYDLNRY